MYPGLQVKTRRDQTAFIMASTGERVSFGALEARSNRLAHLLRAQGLNRSDHFAIFMENNARYIECCAAGERSGLYYTAINSYLKGEELAYILQNSQSRVVDGIGDGSGGDKICRNFEDATRDFPDTPIPDERLGSSMLYSSGTTGRPKGIIRPLIDEHPEHETVLYRFLKNLWLCRENMIYLSPAPLYHSAPMASVNLAIRSGGTVIIMERFDPEHFLQLVETYGVTHSQLVPTMFSRMLKLPDDIRCRYDLSSLETAIHGAAPCPVPIKEKMIEWWGPIIHEYYGATEGLGFAACNSEEWLAHKGTVGRVVFGDLQILDDDMQPSPAGETGTMWFKTVTKFEYFNDSEKTAEARSKDGSMSTVGDVGYVDKDGYLYLTDRKSFMIISGGVNIYPQECENLLISHPKIADAAVFGVPNKDLGEEVKAVIELLPGYDESNALRQELILYCKDHLASMKCPRSIDFTDELPRLPTGKLYKRKLRDKYWADFSTNIA